MLPSLATGLITGEAVSQTDCAIALLGPAGKRGGSGVGTRRPALTFDKCAECLALVNANPKPDMNLVRDKCWNMSSS